MKLAVSVGQVRAMEAAAVEAGTSLAALMDRAGTAVAHEASSLAPEGRIAIVAGPGNNGGDGWVAARALRESGREVLVVSLADPASLPSPAREAAAGAAEMGVPWELPDPVDRLDRQLEGAALVVDAVLGIGARGAPRHPLSAVLDALDDVTAPVLAVDVPSGVDAETGAVPGAAVHADVTVTFGAPKAGMLLHPAAGFAGEIVVADIGLPEPESERGGIEIWEGPDLAFMLPLPEDGANKYSRGRVLVGGGAPGMTGAVCLAARGALRTGAGYVAVAVPDPSLAVVEIKLTSPVKHGLPADAGGALADTAVDELERLCRRADVVVLGPGLGRSDGTTSAVRRLLERLTLPVVLDADGLWALSDDLEPVRRRTAPTVLTPHVGEAARMLGATASDIEDDRPAAVRELAGEGVVCLLKGPRTLVSDGQRTAVTMTGGPALATLGTGDVLSGMIGALLAQRLPAFDAAVLAAHLHGAAGDAAADALTPVCCTAEDVLTYLPRAVRRLLDE